MLLIDPKGRRFMVRLQRGASFHFHDGVVPHDLILDAPEGTSVRSSLGTRMTCLRPRMADFVLKMPRGAQVIYPKDIAAILMQADISPGSQILEAGTGSGALTIALCRAAGPEGRVVSYERREEFHVRAATNIESFFGKLPPVALAAGPLIGARTQRWPWASTQVDMTLHMPLKPKVAESFE